MIYLHTLGDTLMRIDEREIRPTSPMLFAALLYLGMERGRRVPRAALQELLFPNADERSGAHSLRQLLYKLRQLGAPIEAEGDTISIPAKFVSDDSVGEFGLTNGHAQEASKYARGLLPDYSPGLSDRYDEWLEHQRASVAATVRRQLVAAMGTSRNSVDWTAVERLAQVILQIDPLNEEATLALAEATALSGSKAQAIALLTSYEQETGRADLKLAPSLLRRRISDRLPNQKRGPLRTPFVGRDTDAAVLGHEIRRVRASNSAHVVIAGEPGIGKSRLLEEAASLAVLDGLHVHTVRCQPHHKTRPLGVFIELVPSLLSCRGALGVSPQSLDYLRLLVSHDDDRADGAVDARDDVSRSALLVTAIRDLIDAVAAETALFVAIEDVHCADTASLRELSELVHASRTRPLMLVYTTRALEELRQIGAIHDETTICKLRPLGEESMEGLACFLLSNADEGTPKDIVAWCAQSAGGNPLFLQALCAHYTETREPYSVPRDLVSATTRRLEQLSPDCRRILQFCALLQNHSSTEALQSLAEFTQLQLLNAIQCLEEDGFLQLRAGSVQPSHELLGECALSLLPPISRRLLHARVAGNLERRYHRTRDAALLWDCAEQWTASGQTDKAVQFLRRCARHATAIGSASYALSILERARPLARSREEVGDLLGQMMTIARAADEWGAVHNYSIEFAALWPKNEAAMRHTDLELLSVEARWATQLEAQPTVPQLLECVGAEGASAPHRTDAALLLLKIAHEQGDAALAEKAFSSVERLLDKNSLRYADRAIPLIYHASFGDAEQALRLARLLASELDAFKPGGIQFRLALNASLALTFLGAQVEGRSLGQAYFEKSGMLGMTGWQRDFATELCWSFVSIEDYEQAEPWYQFVENARSRREFALATRIHLSNGLAFAIWKRDTVKASAILEQLARIGVGDSVRGVAHLRASELLVKQFDAEFQCDEETLAELSALYERTKSLTGADALTLAFGEALIRRNRRAEARKLIDDYVHICRRERTPMPSLISMLRRLQPTARGASLGEHSSVSERRNIPDATPTY